MPAPRKYPDELRQRAIRLVMDSNKDAEARLAELEREVRELCRATMPALA
ncbi:hypothetical protein [Arthrobacter sp. 35W]|nr:hypothetical protein [Arthrobacter sp. 35W]